MEKASEVKNPRRLVSVDVGGEYFGVSGRTVRRYVSAGLLPAFRVGSKTLRISLDDIDAMLLKIPTAANS